MKGRRYILPLSAIAAGVFLLNGCLPVPGSFDTPSGRRPESFIGRNDPLAVGQSDRARVVEVLGKPALETNDGALIYAYPVETSKVVWLLCGWQEREFSPRWLLLRFDERGQLRKPLVTNSKRRIERETGASNIPTEDYQAGSAIHPRRESNPAGKGEPWTLEQRDGR